MVVSTDNGKIEMTAQASGSQLGKFTPPVVIDQEQEQIFSSRLGTYISDVNMTPDFPSVARAAKDMWEVRYGTTIDGVVAIDPTVLSHILAASGPVPLDAATALGIPGSLPSALTAENVVKTLLSDVYSATDNRGQDQFFGYAAQQVFEVLSAGKVPPTKLAQALAQSTAENRLHVWSRWDDEQLVLESKRLGGAISSGPDAGTNSFGAFFNDGTGAKMDFHVKRTVQLIQECPKSDGWQTTVRVTSTNFAPADAATSLSPYVTGAGLFGVPPGVVQTNIVVYGPAHSNIETAKLDGQRTSFAPHLHGKRPVGVLAIKLGPGESHTVDVTFGSFMQGGSPSILVTPTVQNVRDVILPTVTAPCN